MKQNNILYWKRARNSGQTLQATVLCTYAPVFSPFIYHNKAGELKGAFQRLFVLQKEYCPFTVIEDALEMELKMIKDDRYNPWGVQIMPKIKNVEYTDSLNRTSHKDMYYNEYLEVNFFNPDILHVGRVTDATIQRIAACKYTALAEALAVNPYILYRPSRFSWAEKVIIDGSEEEISIPIPGKSEAQQKRNNTLLFGLATSAALIFMN